jgi:carbon storage regulator CsrA
MALPNGQFTTPFAPGDGDPTMLVLSRRPSEKIVFPSLGIAVQVLSIRGNAVKIGIDAAPNVQILRGELVGTPSAATPPRPADPTLADRLQRASELLGQYQAQRDLGHTAQAEETLARLTEVLQIKEQAAPTQPMRQIRRASVLPDLLVERAGFQGLANPDK